MSSKATQGVTLVAGTNTDAMDDFVAAWDIANSAYQPAFVLVSALFALTSAGERPVAVDRLAATVRRPVAETRALAGSLGELVRLDNADVHLVLGTSSPSPRFLVRIGDRTIKAGGCAPDLFWIAVCSGKTVRVDTECQASGAPIHVEIDPDGVTVEPPTTVVAVVHPGRQPELMDTIDATITNTAGPDEDFCYHQPFFAAPDAGATWLAAHPGGRLFTVAEFLEFWRRVTIETLGKATVDSALTR